MGKNNWSTSEHNNVSKHVYDLFTPEDTVTKKFYAGIENLNDGKIEFRISKFDQFMISDLVKHLPTNANIVVTIECNQKEMRNE